MNFNDDLLIKFILYRTNLDLLELYQQLLSLEKVKLIYINESWLVSISFVFLFIFVLFWTDNILNKKNPLFLWFKEVNKNLVIGWFVLVLLYFVVFFDSFRVSNNEEIVNETHVILLPILALFLIKLFKEAFSSLVEKSIIYRLRLWSPLFLISLVKFLLGFDYYSMDTSIILNYEFLGDLEKDLDWAIYFGLVGIWNYFSSLSFLEQICFFFPCLLSIKTIISIEEINKLLLDVFSEKGDEEIVCLGKIPGSEIINSLLKGMQGESKKQIVPYQKYKPFSTKEIKILNCERKIAISPNSRLSNFIEISKIYPTENSRDFFTNLTLQNVTTEKDFTDIENGELPTWLANNSNLTKPKNANSLKMTKHFENGLFETILDIRGKKVFFKSYTYLNDQIIKFNTTKTILKETRQEMFDLGADKTNISLAQFRKNGKYLGFDKEKFQELNGKLTSIALHDSYNEIPVYRKSSLETTELLLTDGDQINPLNLKSHPLLRLQLVQTDQIAEALGAEILPNLGQGQGEFLMMVNGETTLLELKTETHVVDKKSAIDKIEKILFTNKEVILDSNLPFSYAFTFPNLNEEFTFEDVLKLETIKKVYGEKLSLMLILTNNENSFK